MAEDRIDTSLPITLIGLGSIGISFAALYLTHTTATVSVYDPRPDLEEHICSVLPIYLANNKFHDSSSTPTVPDLKSTNRLRICTTLESACTNAHIIQESGPENLTFKSNTWHTITKLVPVSTHLWSSTSGIPASQQIANLDNEADKSRLLVVHPYNPAHIMPLLEICPSPHTDPSRSEYAKRFFEALNSGHTPVILHKEVPGFVGNRLAFVLFREACHLVASGVVSVEDLDKIVQESIAPRWAVAGPMKTYHLGGGTKGLDGFLSNLAGTVEEVWSGAGQVTLKGTRYLAKEHKDVDSRHEEGGEGGQSWVDGVVEQTNKVYGMPTPDDFTKRDQALRRIFKAKKTQDDE